MECGHPAADHREVRLDLRLGPWACGGPCYLPRSKGRHAAPPPAGSRGLAWCGRPRRERGGRPELVGARVRGRFNCSGGGPAAPPLAGSCGLVKSGRPQQERGGRFRRDSACICGGRPVCRSWGPMQLE
ncbi:hypothetical protein NDU88_002795 [Pleurodeles waltl]|uniref:Uncharacterized protein n=1 Tax=Pleurodeles waltl TaxID=8319 RepID=A0AAV7UX70_PLEWA|nr:hypothetical protein NDU88_002795 [Pleurodeles waltl]